MTGSGSVEWRATGWLAGGLPAARKSDPHGLAATPCCTRSLPLAPHPPIRAHPCTAGESEADHRELVDFCASFRFERMGCFQYSEEDGTPAAELPDQVRSARGAHTQRHVWHRAGLGCCRRSCPAAPSYHTPLSPHARARRPAQVPAEVREARRDELVSQQQRLGEEWAASLVGQEVSAAAAPAACWRVL